MCCAFQEPSCLHEVSHGALYVSPEMCMRMKSCFYLNRLCTMLVKNSGMPPSLFQWLATPHISRTLSRWKQNPRSLPLIIHIGHMMNLKRRVMVTLNQLDPSMLTRYCNLLSFPSSFQSHLSEKVVTLVSETLWGTEQCCVVVTSMLSCRPPKTQY